MKILNLLPKREQNSNKGSFGTVLNISGSKQYSGAAVLSGIAALRCGAGKVITCSTQNTLNAVSQFAPEIVLQLREDIDFKNINSIVLGCGLSQDEEATELVKKVLKMRADIPLVIDADGLNILAKLEVTTLPKNTILTPHPKEMARLMKISLEKVLNYPNEVIEQCVEKYNCVVVLKKHNTLIMDTNKETYINNTGNSALAKAGSGDVLAGMIGGFLAQGLTCYNSSVLAVYLHGLAGELAAEKYSEYSVLAGELLKYIGYAIKKVQKEA